MSAKGALTYVRQRLHAATPAGVRGTARERLRATVDALEFFMPMKPPTVTAQAKGIDTRGSKPRTFAKPEAAAAREKLKAHLAKHVPEEPFDGPLRLSAKWCYPMVKGTYSGQPKHTKPDTDNLEKALKDVMEELGYFVNDSRVAEEYVGKYWAEIPGIWIRLESIE